MLEIDAIIVPQVRRKMSFLAVLFATMMYYYDGDLLDETSTGIIDLSGDSILSKYDFIIVGGGSAGKNNTYYYIVAL